MPSARSDATSWAAAAHGGGQRVADGAEGQQRQEPGQEQRERPDLLELGDLGGWLRRGELDSTLARRRNAGRDGFRVGARTQGDQAEVELEPVEEVVVGLPGDPRPGGVVVVRARRDEGQPGDADLPHPEGPGQLEGVADLDAQRLGASRRQRHLVRPAR